MANSNNSNKKLVPEAMNACIKEHKKTSKKQVSTKKKQEEKVPDWFDQTIDKKTDKKEEEELANLISNYK